MSEENAGAVQGALLPREGLSPRSVAERPAVRITHVPGGQYVLTSPAHGMPTLTQVNNSNISPPLIAQGGTTSRLINFSSTRIHTSTARPSVANQNIVNALTKPRTNNNVRNHLMPTSETGCIQTSSSSRSPMKRSLSPTQREKELYNAKLQRVLNHRSVRSQILREKYNENLMERYYLETSGSILELPQFAKRQKTQHYLTYLNDNVIESRDTTDYDNTHVTETKVDMPAATVTASTSVNSTFQDSFKTTTHVTASEFVCTKPVSSNSIIKAKLSSNLNSINNQEQIVEKAKQEAYVMQRINDLQKEGLWSEKRLPKVQEMPRIKAHWDFLLEEMIWLAADFAQERKWKKAAAKKCARMVQKHFQDKALSAQKAEKAHEQHLRRVASFYAREVKNFWANVEKLVEYKQHTRLEEKRKKAFDQQLSFIVDQTEKYSQLLAKGMNKFATSSNLSEVLTPPSTRAPSRLNSDDEFKPDAESTDDEETIALEEEGGVSGDQHKEEIANLQRESEMDLESFLKELPKDYLENRDNIKLTDSEPDSNDMDQDSDLDKEASDESSSDKGEDMDFIASSTSEDDEVTIQEQEIVEGVQNHREELDDLEAENAMSIEELRKKYNGIPLLSAVDGLSSSSSSSSASSNCSIADSESEESDNDSDIEVDISDNETLGNEVGLQSLLEDSGRYSQNEGEEKTDNQDLIDDAAAIAESIQPKGNTLSSTSVVTPIPFLLKYVLREYQHIGLDWLVTMYERKLNGILADEMGLGKTIQTIALMAHLACEKENWGPHLIIVPTSVMLNWEMECKKWCPAFKILTYYGTQKERKQKRMGWTKPNAFHICITSYKLVIQDHQSFRRKKWKYLILDEAQNIKNFKSQRWQLLLNFSTQQRLLLTGTPLQNNLMELWSLMHFLMPHVFQSHREFKEWFSNPVTGMIEGNAEYNESIIKRLHKVLRPFLLRRLKSEVEKQMPKKYEHVVICRLSKRQRFLYDDYMSRAKTKETLATGNLLSVINVLMQLRKVCNHPNLFEVRPTISPFQCEGIRWHIPSIVFGMLNYNVWKHIDFYSLNMNLVLMELSLSAYQCYRMRQYQTSSSAIEEIELLPELTPKCPPARLTMHVHKAPFNNAKSSEDAKVNTEVKSGQTINVTPSNLKYKIAPSGILQLVQQPLKVAENSTQNVFNKIMFQSVAGQVFHTSTGKQIILAPSTPMSISSTITIPASTGITTGGRLTLLPKQSVSGGQIVTNLTKALPKIQLMSVSSPINTSLPTVIPNDLKTDDEMDNGRKTVGNKFIDKLYSSQSNNLDVRWKKQPFLQKRKSDNGEIVSDYFKNKLELIARVNERRCNGIPLYGRDFHDSIKIYKPAENLLWRGGRIHCLTTLYNMHTYDRTDCLSDLLYTPERRIEQFENIFDKFIVYVSAVHAPLPEIQVWHPDPSIYWGEKNNTEALIKYFSKPATCLHSIASAMVTQFPDPRLLQYDCGKLRTLDRLLRTLKVDGHRVLIFTQMTKMLDVLEAFLNFHGHIYLRLDGSTKVDQRQVLMERFNGDPRIFAFILSTRSGGIGVNLTGADTVIFYDSDWNPTMDAQAQDRCHRIGQTRDVHIYRLVSERTIEENILKKANQKRLLGDLAIEGGNFTTAFFKSSTIQDLFEIDSNEESAAGRLSGAVQASKDDGQDIELPPIDAEDKAAVGILENALATCEDDQDVLAARTATAEAVADLAEFDENIPIDDQEKEKDPEISKVEQELDGLIKQLTPIERYAMDFIEQTEVAWSAEQLAAAEREIDKQKHEWEQNRLVALQVEEEKRARDLEDDDILTYSREDATNQIWVSDNTMEQMPMWCPPTPPQQDTDVYIDHTLSFLYNSSVMTESQLPPIFIKKEAKRLRHDAGLVESRRPMKIQRKDDASVYAPRSLFERPSPALVKMRRDLKLQKYRGVIKSPSSAIPGVKLPTSKPDAPIWHNWTINEDMALLKVIQSFQGLPLNLMVLSPGHTANWDLVADYVNTVSLTFRTAKQCRYRYESVILPREEGKLIFDSSARKKKNKTGLYKIPPITKSHRSLRTSQLFNQDNNSKFTQIMIQRFETLKGISTKQIPSTKTSQNSANLKFPKHTTVLSECGIDLDSPVLPVEVAARRAERVAKEKKSLTPEKFAAAQRLQLIKSAQMPNGQASPTLQTSAAQLVTATTTAQPITTSPISQPQVINQSSPIPSPISTATIVSSTPAVPNQLRTQRIIATPIQAPTSVVSVSALNSGTLQSGPQRLIVSSTTGQTKTVLGNTATVTSKPISHAHLQMIRQATLKQQQLRLQSGGLATPGVKTTTVTVAGQTAIQVQFTQAQPRTQFIKQGTITVGGKQGITRTVTETEMAQILKRQQQLHQKVLAVSGVTNAGSSQSAIQSLGPQVYAQALQAGTPGTPVATLVKAVSGSGISQTVTIPVTAVTIGGSTVKASLAPGVKPTTAQQIRQLQLQQQILTQKKLVNQKIAGITQVAGKGGVATQLIVGSKPLPTAITMQQFQQVIRSPIAVQQGPVVLTKGTQRVIPVNTQQGTKQTIQVVAASQGLTTAIRPQTSSTLAGALAGIKVQGATASQAQQALLSQVSAALQGQAVGIRQNSPVRIQTSGNSTVAVSLQSGSTMQPGTLSQTSSVEQIVRFLKK